MRGRNGLSRVQKLGVDIIKIDKSFVDTIATARQSQAITTTVVGLARALDLQIIAEGVETAAQLRQLESNHCEFAQGFLFSPALDAAGLRDLFHASSGP